MYGIQVEVISSNGGHTLGDLARFLDTNPTDSKQLVDASFGSPNQACSGDSGPGMAAAGTSGGAGANCADLGNALIVPEDNTPESVSNP